MSKKKMLNELRMAEQVERDRQADSADRVVRKGLGLPKSNKPDWADEFTKEIMAGFDSVSGSVKELSRSVKVLSDEVKKNREDISALDKRVTTLESVCTRIPGKSANPAEPEPDGQELAKSPEEKEPVKTEPKPDVAYTSFTKNGAGLGYRYWDASSRTYGLTPDIWAAKQLSNGIYEPIWVWYIDNRIDHILSKEELLKYAP